MNQKSIELDNIYHKYELLMRRFYCGTVKYRMRIGGFVIRNLVLKERGDPQASTGESFNKQLIHIKEYLKYGIARFSKRYPKDEDLQNESLFWIEKIDEAQSSNDIINIVCAIYENGIFKKTLYKLQ